MPEPFSRFRLIQLCELWCEQAECPAQHCLPSLVLQAIASLPQQPLPSLVAHCLPFLPAQQFMAVWLSLLSCLQQVMSLPSQQDMEFAASLFPCSFFCSQHAHADLSAAFAASCGPCACGAAACGPAFGRAAVGNQAVKVNSMTKAIVRVFIFSPQ